MATNDEEMGRFNAWCREEALVIRHHAAALGHPAEYEYLTNYPFILERYKQVVPEWGTMNMDSVLSEACDDSIPLDLVEINRIRAEIDEPALDFVPEVQGRCEFGPSPTPKTRPGVDEQTKQFYAWAKDQISGAYHSAAARGTDPRAELFSCPWILVGRVVRHFPALNPAWCLRTMDFSLEWMRPEVLDQQRIENIRSWTTTFKEVGDELDKRIAEADKPPELKS
jgi:hypothetical protein